MAIATGNLGARLYTSATALTDIEAAVDAVSDFTALTITTELGLVESFGEFGRVFETVKFVPLATGRSYKLKGAYDDGKFEIMLASDLGDAGQAAFRGYAVTVDQLNYPFKITLTGADASYDTIYFGGKCMSYVRTGGSVNGVWRAKALIEINTPIYTNAT